MYWQKKRVLITGHEGFLGSWLTKVLLAKEAKVIGLDKVKNRPISVLNGLRKKVTCIKGDICNPKLLKSVIDKYRPEVIFHLAAEAIVNRASKNPSQTFKSNIEGTWGILEAARGRKFIESIVIASSDKAYGSHNILPYKENAALKGKHPYDVSKSCADLIAYTYFYTYEVPVSITRCGNIFGPGDFNFSRIVPDAIRSALSGKKLLIRSDGKFTRDYIYVEDVVTGYIALAQKMQKLKLFGEAFNFSNEKPISVLELTKLIYKSCQKECNCKILNQAKYEIRYQYLSATKAKKVLKWQPKYTLREGLSKTINWYGKTFQKG